jgi:hypothetical protein
MQQASKNQKAKKSKSKTKGPGPESEKDRDTNIGQKKEERGVQKCARNVPCKKKRRKR